MQIKSKPFVVMALVLALGVSMSFATDVTFQVNMGWQIELGSFDPLADMVVVRGDFNGWSGNDYEVTALNDSIYTGTFDIPEGNQGYKYVIVPGEGWDNWESRDNRYVDVGVDPIVLDVVYWNDEEWLLLTDVEVYFQVNMEIMELQENFDPLNDLVVIRGNHPNLGNWGGAVAMADEGDHVFGLEVQFDDLGIGENLEYKFVILENGDEGLANWETIDNRVIVPTGDEPDDDMNGYGEIEPGVAWFSNVTGDDIITSDLLVHFIVDCRPAYYKIDDPEATVNDVQTGEEILAIDEVNIAGNFNGWPWGAFPVEYTFNDDGIEPDEVAGDSVWSGSVQFYALDPVDQIYKYGLNELDAEANFGEDHMVVLDDSGPEQTVIDTFGTNGSLYDEYIELLLGPPLTISATPQVDPVIIPDVGGSFNWDVVVENVSNNTYTFDAWTGLLLPDGTPWGPLDVFNDITLLSGFSIIAAPEQDVPAFAPPGVYTYYALVGQFPVADAFATFEFEKLAGPEIAANTGLDMSGWTLSGWFDEEVLDYAGVKDLNNVVPSDFEISAVYPNPFNPSTTIEVGLPDNGLLSVSVFNIEGRQVAVLANGAHNSGYHQFVFDGTNLSSGIYLVRAELNGHKENIHKIMLIK